MRRSVAFAVVLTFASAVRADDEFFERKVRPVLVEHCYSCHSPAAKKLKGGLRVDSLASLLKGGDTGPAIVPGDPSKSLFVKAISYEDVDLAMPPRAKLPASAIADLTKWIADGAKWPGPGGKDVGKEPDFDIAKRKAEHWAWQPIANPAPPAGPAKSAVDRFLHAGIAKAGLKTASTAPARVLVRRLHFDLVGLPPTPEEVDAFEKAHAADPRKATEAKVDALLASPAFGERWGRHWLDLMRYAESRGHEFDYASPNAYQYRDYVIRAVNADVPHDRLILEHLAGDLLREPRLNPERGFDESILGTGFWFLGEQVHSPVDTGLDKADRFDNMLDVMSKAFFGLTVSCARCHDHKFDAISTRDYYALFGFLESSSYRLAAFDVRDRLRTLAGELHAARSQAQDELHKGCIGGSRGEVGKSVEAFSQAVRQLTGAKASDDPRVAAWVTHLTGEAQTSVSDPFHALATLLAVREPAARDAVLAKLRALRADATTAAPGVVIDYAAPGAAWIPDGVGYGPGPVLAGTPILGKGATLVGFARRSAAVRDVTWDRVGVAPGTENDPGALGGPFRFERTLCTPKFMVTAGPVHALVRGSGRVFANVDGHVMLAGPLHGQTMRGFKTPEFQWQTLDLTRYIGRRVHLEFSAADGADLAVAEVTQGKPRRAETIPWPEPVADPVAYAKSLGEMLASDVGAWRDWAFKHPRLVPMAGDLAPVSAKWAEKLAEIEARIPTQARLAPAMLDNVGVDERVYVRGSHKVLGEPVSRRFLEALAPEPIAPNASSGRLELAQRIVDPKLNPFVARVAVNRAWHHLFGRGLVSSVDNFGVLGEAPTHPELLDWLAGEFVRDGWSTKRLLRSLVLTEAYARASRGDDAALKADPSNLLLSHQNLRRLEGEAIRDAMLAISGRLDRKMFGPAVPVHLTDFQQGRGRPASGPVDGAGRRSVYLAVRRNFLSPFLLAFDTPIPFSTVGRRTVSNVPAQALILLNDPFVHQQAELWAKRSAGEATNAEARVRRMIRAAYAREADADEVAACLAYVGPGDAAAWSALAHVLFNAKEFVYVE